MSLYKFINQIANHGNNIQLVNINIIYKQRKYLIFFLKFMMKWTYETRFERKFDN